MKTNIVGILLVATDNAVAVAALAIVIDERCALAWGSAGGGLSGFWCAMLLVSAFAPKA